MPPARASKEARKEQILQAAIACFSRKGYHLTTMDDIVAESGLSKGSLYWHYKNKKDLLLSIMTWYFNQMIGEMEGSILNAATAFDKLKIMLDGFMQIVTSQEPIFGVFIDFFAETRHDQEVEAAFRKLLIPYIDFVAGIIHEGVDNGQFKPVKARQMAVGLMAALDGVVLYHMMLTDDFDWPQTAQQFEEIFLYGLCK